MNSFLSSFGVMTRIHMLSYVSKICQDNVAGKKVFQF